MSHPVGLCATHFSTLFFETLHWRRMLSALSLIGRGTSSNCECFRNHAANVLVRSSSDTAAFSLYMTTARRPSSGEIVHMCGQDSFPSYKCHILRACVLPISRLCSSRRCIGGKCFQLRLKKKKFKLARLHIAEHETGGSLYICRYRLSR